MSDDVFDPGAEAGHVVVELLLPVQSVASWGLLDRCDRTGADVGGVGDPAFADFDRAVDEFRDDGDIGVFEDVEDRFGFHSWEDERVGLLLPVHQKGHLVGGDFDHGTMIR
ncbi:hypothetical protein [Acidipropionibacterium jensenii]|uniref:hypothetical protein n=1 Tax=Acidipropionibacterium jensenii TaxID=1749 RepID=UPI0013869F57|nr:hypothetical protein [Acidipropionibacterium jensenii]